MSQTVQQLLAQIEQSKAAAVPVLGHSGPRTVNGKKRVALNGVTHGLTGQNVFLEESEYPAYMDFGRQYIAEFRPVGIRETQNAQKIIDLNWRLNTVSAIENNLFHSSRIALVRNNDPNDDRIVSMITKADVWRKDCSGPDAFVKLGRYEAHLARTMARVTLDLERLQAARLRKGDDTFRLESCQAWLWYERMYHLYTDLAAAHRADSEGEPTLAESTGSDVELLRKNSAQPEKPAVFTAASGAAEHPVEAGEPAPEPPKNLDTASAESKAPRTSRSPRTFRSKA